MELPIEFNKRATDLATHKGEDYKVADISKKLGYQEGATDMLNAIEKMLNNMLQDLYTPEEKNGIKDVLKYLHTVKPLNTETNGKL